MLIQIQPKVQIAGLKPKKFLKLIPLAIVCVAHKWYTYKIQITIIFYNFFLIIQHNTILCMYAVTYSA